MVYRVTDYGYSLRPVIEMLYNWGENYNQRYAGKLKEEFLGGS
ncbi:winged helix-turn-helix transcriptional regulator [Pediococcus pentosaceus]|nr:hypothetical protein GBP24_07875 [Pediococcus pentosaceus]MBF7121536.1 winged helix-turn-helix transcriptional regulator [Pediococcus pentosaceus]MBF7140137.1 winged helix-turn-helix transcriptional regulator [Pediococcus pentosaceus]MCE5960472.1 winged helix-turn-helix transcriptional regulator [Pediococcus pentosaceus]MCS8562971.1 hypothetical protein [Pediococcus pentosaceus]